MLPLENPLSRLEQIRELEESQRGAIEIVLINTPLDLYASGSSPKYDTIFPFGLLILSEIAKSLGFSSIVIDGEAARLSIQEITAYVKKVRPIIVGINLLSPTIDIASRIVKQISEDGLIVVGGGPHATFEPYDCFERIPELNYLFRGEAVKSWQEFLGCLKHDVEEAVASIQGIWSRDKANGIGERTIELEELPTVDRSAAIFPSYQIGGREETAIFASIGCAEKCRYCAGRAFSGGIVRYRQVSSLVDEIESCVNVGINAFHFADDNFIQNVEYVRAFAQELKRRNLIIHWRSFARADDVSEQVVELLVQSGCYRLTFGIESGCQRTLENMGKGHTISDAIYAIERCRAADIKTKAFFMLGYPDETRDEIEETVTFALNSGLDWAYFYLVRAFPGTLLFRDLTQRGFSKQELLQYIHWMPRISEGCTMEQQKYREVLEKNNIFNVDSIFKYNVAHQRSINGVIGNDELTEIMADAYRRFYFRREFVERFSNQDMVYENLLPLKE